MKNYLISKILTRQVRSKDPLRLIWQLVETPVKEDRSKIEVPSTKIDSLNRLMVVSVEMIEAEEGLDGMVMAICSKLGHIALQCYCHNGQLNPNLNTSQGRGQHPSSIFPSNQGSLPSTMTPNKAFMTTQNSNPFVATPESMIDSGWYVDSGASNHIVFFIIAP